jgi:hypothetical protein
VNWDRLETILHLRNAIVRDHLAGLLDTGGHDVQVRRERIRGEIRDVLVVDGESFGGGGGVLKT